MPSPWFVQLRTNIKNINLFKDVQKTNEEDIKNQKISTIIFLILLTVSIIALFLYSAFTPATKTVVINQPSISDYKQLERKYPHTLVCPCTSVSNEYNKFISTFTPTFNQICLSDFVSDSWLNYINYRPSIDRQYHFIFDFRHSAYAFFNLLRTICILASETINDQLIVFYSKIFLTTNVISEGTFLNNIYADRDQFLNTSSANFVTTLNTVLLAGQFSGILNNRLLTNYALLFGFLVDNYNVSITGINTPSLPVDVCSYPNNAFWCMSTGIYFRKLSNNTKSTLKPENYTSELQFEVTGVLVGNFLLYPVLQSNLSCFYDEDCILKLNNYLNDTLYPFNATPLTVPSSSLRLPTISDLAKQLMVDFWQLNSSYEDYFNACNASTCVYSYASQFDVLFIITTVVSFIGGIVTILMIIILPIVSFLRKRLKLIKLFSSSTATTAEPCAESSGNGKYYMRIQKRCSDIFIHPFFFFCL